MKILMSLSVVLLLAATGMSATIYVPDDYLTIQGAINASANGDTVLVSPGTYVENIDFLGKAITLKSDKGPFVTIIDGNRTGTTVVFQNYEGSDSVIDGFTITNGYMVFNHPGGGIRCRWAAPTITHNRIVSNEAGHGGGIACWDASPVICHNTIADNLAYGQQYSSGGGIELNFFANPTITENVIEGNKAPFGGGIYCGPYSRPTIAHNRINGNYAGREGGGLKINDSDPEITSNELIGNIGLNLGGGICCIDGDPIISNNIVGANLSPRGGGLYCKDSVPYLIHNTIAENESSDGAGGLELVGCYQILGRNTILSSNTGLQGPEIYLYGSAANNSFIYLDSVIVEGGWDEIEVEAGSHCFLQGNGITNADPLLADPANGDFHLTADSPARESGQLFANGIPWKDFEGDPRVPASTVDIGADEYYTHLYALGDVIPRNAIDVKLVGTPGLGGVRIITGAGVRQQPLPTIHGDFHLEGPIRIFTFGPIPQNGIFSYTLTVPVSWNPGDHPPFQALVGEWGNPDTTLSNLMVMFVE